MSAYESVRLESSTVLPRKYFRQSSYQLALRKMVFPHYLNYKHNNLLVRRGSLDKPFLPVGRDLLFLLGHLVLPKITIKKFLISVREGSFVQQLHYFSTPLRPKKKKISLLVGYMNQCTAFRSDWQIKLTGESKCQPTAEPSYGKLGIRIKWPIRPELIPVFVA